MNSSPPLSQESKIVPELIGIIESFYHQLHCLNNMYILSVW